MSLELEPRTTNATEEEFGDATATPQQYVMYGKVKNKVLKRGRGKGQEKEGGREERGNRQQERNRGRGGREKEEKRRKREERGKGSP